jgi:hypothetical protein
MINTKFETNMYKRNEECKFEKKFKLTSNRKKKLFIIKAAKPEISGNF